MSEVDIRDKRFIRLTIDLSDIISLNFNKVADFLIV